MTSCPEFLLGSHASCIYGRDGEEEKSTLPRKVRKVRKVRIVGAADDDSIVRSGFGSSCTENTLLLTSLLPYSLLRSLVKARLRS